MLTKYNDYASLGGTGVNKLAILDPNAQQNDLVLPATRVMKDVLTIAGVTPDQDFPNNPGPSGSGASTPRRSTPSPGA